MTNSNVLHAVLGTAGHIDHGKSSLVKALTGTNPDRFREEQERGMTIDIGFAEYRTPDGTDVGLIDVPGHERFIRNMVAGAAGMDMVMLVVAADDSVMPQTREHLEIMTLLGLQRGFVVITKIDMVDPELIELVEEEISEFVAGTFLEGAPMLRCSSINGVGIPEVRQEIDRLVKTLPPRDLEGVFRMPVQRAFTVKGHGTVVTGVPLTGKVVPGDHLELLPQAKEGRVRSLQVHHQAAEEGGAGLRTAINITDIAYKEVSRGDVLATPGFFTAATMVEARFTLLPSWRGPLKNRTPVRFHTGCAEVLGRLILLDAKRLDPGEDALVQIQLDEPIVVAPGDHYLLRMASPEKTIGGGLVLGETRYRFKRFRDWITENMKGKEAHLQDRDQYLEYVIRSEGLHPVSIESLPLLVKEARETVLQRLDDLRASGRVCNVAAGREVIHTDMVEKGASESQAALLGLHEADHYPFGFSAQAVASEMKHPPAATALFLDRAVQSKKVEQQGKLYRLKAFKGGLSKEDRRILTAVEEKMKSSAFATPSSTVLAEELQKPKKRVENILTLLEGRGIMIHLGDGVWLHQEHVFQARDLFVKYCQEHGAMPSNAMKDVIQSTRKYVIPLLEYFDRQGLCVRKDSSRYLVDGYEDVLVNPSAGTASEGSSES